MIMGKRIRKLPSFRSFRWQVPSTSRIFILFNVFLVTVIGGLSVVLALAVSSEPDIRYSGGGGKDSYAHAEEWMSHIRDAFEQDQLNRLSIEPSDIRDLAFYLANRVRVSGKKAIAITGIESQLREKAVVIRASLRSPLIEKVYLNMTMTVSEHEDLPELDSVKIGKVSFPGWLLRFSFKNMLLPLLPDEQAKFWKTLTGSVKAFDITPRRITLVYRSGKELRQQLKASAMSLMLGSPEEKEAIQLYLDVLAAAAVQQQGSDLQLSRLLHTLVGLARARSSEGGSAVKENERMLRALAIQLADPSTRVFLAPGMKPYPLSRPILLRGRKDLSQHFMVSAALALTLDEESALNIGVSKERSDARAGGSGFSFPDLVADLAGIRFAVIATEDEARARWLQDFILQNKGEHIFMPEVSWLPQGLTTSAYEDLIRHPLYPAMLDRILRRINSLPLNQDG
ncbi:hypothetical protein [Endozoicomonas arenosclerae]|uniref:hypothetical protein n=1 Tax=Endozoicomonas arenosclerae TaxID=1633495 RepID=UPI00078396E7|nr:hypothetical protein [Endozoicomonas arenosclerae]